MNYDFYCGSHYGQADLDAFAADRGELNVGKAWILTPFDTWEPNPYYVGPKVPHPESYEAEFGDL